MKPKTAADRARSRSPVWSGGNSVSIFYSLDTDIRPMGNQWKKEKLTNQTSTHPVLRGKSPPPPPPVKAGKKPDEEEDKGTK